MATTPAPRTTTRRAEKAGKRGEEENEQGDREASHRFAHAPVSPFGPVALSGPSHPSRPPLELLRGLPPPLPFRALPRAAPPTPTHTRRRRNLLRLPEGARPPRLGRQGPRRAGPAAPGYRPRWAPDAVRGAPQPPPSMNRGGPVPEQLQASRDLVNEGLSGLVPRAKVLLTVGAAVPTAFVGLISVAVCVFAVLALGLEGKFIHGAGVLLLVLLFLFFGVFEREERGEREERREEREKRGEREERNKDLPLLVSLFF